ncbi:KS-MAT linker domain-containing protein, partial [Priestia megaterium]|uniref:KS-MAT linker domain-containing protein n=1 Tax=Priestia megaterium TaxID=1404 RepID=UPI0036DB546E
MRDHREPTRSAAVVVVVSAKTEAQLDSAARNLLAFVEDEPGVGLADLAFSLQVGRAALDFRLAFTADSLAAVARGLRAHLRHDGDAELFLGRVPDQPTWDEEDEERKEPVRALLAAGDHRGIAQAWAEGRVVDWPRLYAPHKPFRVPLPTYPFAKERYWVEARQGAEAGADVPA